MGRTITRANLLNGMEEANISFDPRSFDESGFHISNIPGTFERVDPVRQRAKNKPETWFP